MKKSILLCAALLSSPLCTPVNATNLIEAYQQAFLSDPTYQQAVANRLVNKEGVPISLAGLLPSANATIQPSLTRSLGSGPASFNQGGNTQRGYQVILNLSQTIFDFSKFANLAGAQSISKQADATLSAATQDLMIRTAQAYFKILEDQDNLRYIGGTRTAYAKQLDQVRQQYKVGLKTITDVYTAQASYEASRAAYIGAENTLANDRENLRVLTGHLYPHIAKLREDFPLITPRPSRIDDWVTTAGQQNWSIKSAQYAAEAARQNIKQQFAGHLPTLNLGGSYQINFTRNSGNPDIVNASGSAQDHISSVNLTLAIPIVSGGLVVAQTAQAQYQYQAATQLLEQTLRNTLNSTRQSYLNIISGISKIEADKQTVKSSISSLQGMEAGYRVGTEILVNVLDQQQKVFQAQKQYASDRYAYVNNLLALKQAAGTLSENDLIAINAWLEEGKDPPTYDEASKLPPEYSKNHIKNNKIAKKKHVTPARTRNHLTPA